MDANCCKMITATVDTSKKRKSFSNPGVNIICKSSHMVSQKTGAPLQILVACFNCTAIIDGLRKAGDAPGHKIVVAVCVCVFVVVVVVMLGSSLWGRK